MLKYVQIKRIAHQNKKSYKILYLSVKIINVLNFVLKIQMDNIDPCQVNKIAKKIAKEYGHIINQKNCVLMVKMIVLA